MVIVIGWQVYDIARHTMGLKEAAFRLGLIGLVQFVPLFLLTLVTGWTADRLDRRWIARVAVALELGCAAALGWLALTHTTTLALPVHRGRAARRRPGLRRPGTWCARAQSRPARNPSARNRAVIDRLAERRDPGARAGRVPVRLCAIRALRRQRGLVRHCFRLPARDRASPAHRAGTRAKPVGANGRGFEVRPPQPPRARSNQSRPVCGSPRRSDGDAPGLRPGRAPRRGRRALVICAPHRPSGRPSPQRSFRRGRSSTMWA